MQTDNTSNLAGALCVDQSRSLQTLETAAASVTPPWLVVDSHRTPRVSKACDECRTRKVKCNGGQPCQPCEVRRLSCHYRVNCRRRKNAAFYAKKKLQTIGTTQPPVDDIVTRGHHTDIAEGVYATESLHSPGSLQLFYGPSSNFFLLQRIHHHLGPPTGMIDSLPAGPDEARNGLDRFKYRGLFFGRSLGDPESPIASSDPFENSRLQVKWSLLTSFLPGNLAAEFLGRFIRMELPFLSFVDAFYVQNSIQAAYEAPTSPVSLPEYIRLVAFLALGATMTEHVYWAERLFHQVQELGVALDGEVNLDTVQIALIMYQIQLGRPNSAYLLTGTASRKAIAAGLHREMPSHTTLSSDDVQQRRITFWSLCVFECMICYCLGRPNSISEEDITIQLPNDEFITTMAKLTKIIRKSARVVYGSQERRLVNIWKASQVIQGDLTEFEASLPQRLKFTAQNGSLLCCQSVAHFFLGSVYYHTVLLQFRPLLIFHTSRRRNGDSTDNPAWLEGACMGAVEAARNLIRFISIAYLAMPITKDLRHNGFYIDAACFVLVLNMLGADEPDPEDLDLVRYGLNCLSQMLPSKWEALSHSSYAIEHMIVLLTKEKTFKSNSSLLGVETPNSHDEEVQNMQLQSELDALAQGTFDSLDWDLMDPILGF